MSAGSPFFLYSASLQDFRRLKGYRYGLYDKCEELLAFRVSDNNEYGIVCDGMNVNIKVIFKNEEKVYKFQSEIHRYTKKRSSHELQVMPTLDNELISTIPSMNSNQLARIMTEDYESQEDSPPFSVTQHTHCHSESTSLQAEHCQNPRTNPEITLQMIEPVSSVQFTGQIAEACHLQPKVDDPSNFIYMSRLFHQHFDGIDCPESKVPNMLIHYVAHADSPEQTPVSHVTAYRTTIQIFFRDIELFNSLVLFLKNEGIVVTIKEKRAYQLDLFFENGIKARGYLKHKEATTIKIWNEKASDNSFDFLIES